MRTCSEFYRQRDLRTREYTGSDAYRESHVGVVAGPDATSSAVGQVALLGLANQLARVHRRVTFELAGPDVPCLAWSPVTGRTIGDVVIETMRQIDPCGEFTLGRANGEHDVRVGIGDVADRDLDWYVGADRAVAYLSKSAVPFTRYEGTTRGAALASCLGACAVFRSSLGLETRPRVLSSWDYGESDQAGFGPDDLAIIDVGRTLLVGAGAVAAAFAYWLCTFGVGGEWVIVDRDRVALHNTNRGLLFTPAHSDWFGSEPVPKANVLASHLPAATPHVEWYDESQVATGKFDLVLPLANDRGVRSRIASKSVPVMLHATTGESWLSQMHRHIVGRDDCIACRTGGLRPPSFACSAAEVVSDAGERSDAALPFLSSASGLMLTTALQRLQVGELEATGCNDWRWDFDSLHRMTASGRNRCSEACANVNPNAATRGRLNAHSRWAHLDREAFQ